MNVTVAFINEKSFANYAEQQGGGLYRHASTLTALRLNSSELKHPNRLLLLLWLLMSRRGVLSSA